MLAPISKCGSGFLYQKYNKCGYANNISVPVIEEKKTISKISISVTQFIYNFLNKSTLPGIYLSLWSKFHIPILNFLFIKEEVEKHMFERLKFDNKKLLGFCHFICSVWDMNLKISRNLVTDTHTE